MGGSARAILAIVGLTALKLVTDRGVDSRQLIALTNLELAFRSAHGRSAALTEHVAGSADSATLTLGRIVLLRVFIIVCISIAL